MNPRKIAGPLPHPARRPLVAVWPGLFALIMALFGALTMPAPAQGPAPTPTPAFNWAGLPWRSSPGSRSLANLANGSGQPLAVWSPYPPICNSIGSDGSTLVPNGRMLQPQDQTQSTPTPAVVWVPVGGTLPCQIEQPTDFDTEFTTSGTTLVPGNVVIQWSTAGNVGNFLTDPTQPSTTWQAPNTMATVTLQCTISDTDSVPAGDIGTRKDVPVVRTVTVMVAQKVWDPGTPIGTVVTQNNDGTTTTTLSGQMISPQDQTGHTPNPATVTAIAEQSLDCAVTPAVDQDHWAYEDQNGTVYQQGVANDAPLTCTWSSTAGTGSGFITGWTTNSEGVSVPTLSATTTGTSAQWLAPSIGLSTTPTGYTIKCTISDLPTPLGPLETGNRHDQPLVQTVNVEVVDQPSTADIKLYTNVRHPNGCNTVGTQVNSGGNVGDLTWISFELTVGPGQRLAPGTDAVHLDITDDYNAYWPTVNPVTTEVIGLTSPAGWEKQDEDGNWCKTESGDPAPEDPNQTTTPRIYRCLIPWQTATVPFGNNGPATVDLEETLDFQQDNAGTWGQDTYVQPQAASPTVSNVTVTGVSSNDGTQDYFKWDPLSSNYSSPSISFTITDQGDPQQYKWIIYYAPTATIHATGSTDWTAGAQSISNVVSSAQQVTVNLTASQWGANALGNSNVRGTYTYDIRVVKWYSNQTVPTSTDETGSIDATQFKQPYLLWIPETQPDGQPGHRVWVDAPPADAADNTIKVRANYYLQDDPSANNIGANSVTMQAIDPYLNDAASMSGGTATGTLWGGTQGYEVYDVKSTDPSGDWRVVFTAGDESGVMDTRRRTHDCQRMIALNQVRRTLVFQCFSNPEVYTPFSSNGSPGNCTYDQTPASADSLERAGVIESLTFWMRERAYLACPAGVRPQSIIFRMRRHLPGATVGRPGPAVGPAKYFLANFSSANGYYEMNNGFDITQEMGRWFIAVDNAGDPSAKCVSRSYMTPSVIPQFKIDKRQQIVEMAQDWAAYYPNRDPGSWWQETKPTDDTTNPGDNATYCAVTTQNNGPGRSFNRINMLTSGSTYHQTALFGQCHDLPGMLYKWTGLVPGNAADSGEPYRLTMYPPGPGVPPLVNGSGRGAIILYTGHSSVDISGSLVVNDDDTGHPDNLQHGVEEESRQIVAYLNNGELSELCVPYPGMAKSILDVLDSQ